MNVRDCVRYKNTLKHFIRLRNSSKSVTLDSRRKIQETGTKTKTKYEAKLLLIPQTLRTRAELAA